MERQINRRFLNPRYPRSSHQKNDGECSHHIQVSEPDLLVADDVRSCMAPATSESRKPAKSNPLMTSSFYGIRWVQGSGLVATNVVVCGFARLPNTIALRSRRREPPHGDKRHIAQTKHPGQLPRQGPTQVALSVCCGCTEMALECSVRYKSHPMALYCAVGRR